MWMVAILTLATYKLLHCDTIQKFQKYWLKILAKPESIGKIPQKMGFDFFFATQLF